MPDPSATGAAEWERLLAPVAEASSLGDALAHVHLTPHGRLRRQSITGAGKGRSIVARFIDYRVDGPGTLPEIFDKAEVIVCTEEFSTMISEAVSARLPVVGRRARNAPFHR